MAKQIFVSQATDDKPLVDAFVEFLQLALQIHLSEIYCTTYNPNELPAGEDFVEHIKTNIAGARLVILLITPNYLDSHFCLSELGAAWVMNSNILPIVVPPLNHHALDRTPLRAVRSVRRLEADIDVIAEDIKQKGFDFSIPIFNAQAKKFLQMLPDLLDKINKPQPVSFEAYAELQKELEAVVLKNLEATSELREKENYIKKLEDLGPPAEVQALKRDHLTEWELFSEILQETKDALYPIERVIKSALYYELHGEDFWPAKEHWEEIERYRHQEKLVIDYDKGKITANKEYPDIEQAFNKLCELEEYVADKSSAELHAAFKAEYQIPFSLNTNFWRRLLEVRVITNE